MTHWRSSMDMIFHDRLTSLVHAAQQWATVIVVVLEDSVREPVVAHELPDVLYGVQSGERGGRNIRGMLSGTLSFGVTAILPDRG
ncbi:hypothetical protein QA644_34425 (plasmid) [Rhizobium sp. CC1099]|uniref:hypothetical protein n=1 Tax=Rhizobium sp. CC1099 TaxID=3039160 RepID=UPI0024B04713|nr:hypothetical protein [Rhizobium sp. CC1099]WFU92000.1 hypothetical protein QA644_34425 [Rhizobium sp. CC1099]